MDELPYVIRRAVSKDIPCLVDCRMAMLDELAMVHGEEAIEATRQGTKTYLESHMDDDMFSAWVAEDDGRILGSGMIVYYSVPPSYNNLSGITGYVLNIFTQPEARNQGIANGIMKYILDECRERSVNVVRLRASRFGRPIYEKLGFIIKDSEMELKIEA